MHECGRILSSAIAMMDALEAAVWATAGSPLFHNPSFCESEVFRSQAIDVSDATSYSVFLIPQAEDA
jgi:hypothetical protein